MLVLLVRWVIGPTGDILSGVETTIRVQEAVTILTGSSRPTVKLAGARRKSLGDLLADVDLAMLAANKGPALVVPNAIYHSREIGVCLENSAYRRLAKDPTKMIVLKKSLLSDDICRLYPERSRHPSHCRLLKIYKEGVTVVPTGSNVGGSTYQLSKHLPDMLSPFIGHLPQHTKNSTEIVHTAQSIAVLFPQL
jgi:hypothetical protein